LHFVLENNNDFGFLWENSNQLNGLAWETFRHDIVEGAGLRLDSSIKEIPQRSIEDHGLEGRPLKFKFFVLDSIGNQWGRVKGQFSVREWFKRITEAIDTILDSLIDAAGGLIKEFKDALFSLA